MLFRSTQAETGVKATEDGAEGVQWRECMCLGRPGRPACILGFVAGQGEETAFSEWELANDIPGGFSLDPSRVVLNEACGKVVAVEPCIVMGGLHLL